jgi:chromosome partitioning protein
VAASHVLIPIQSSYFALEGTDDLLETIEKVKARPNPNLELLGVLVTLHDKRTTLAREVYEQIRNVFGPNFLIRYHQECETRRVARVQGINFSFAPTSSGAIEYGKLCKEVISRV